MIHQSEKNLKDFADKVSDADKTAITSAVEDLKKAIEGDNIDDINNKTDALMNASMKLGEAMYKAQQEQASAAGGDTAAGTQEAKKEDDVVDADFEEVKK